MCRNNLCLSPARITRAGSLSPRSAAAKAGCHVRPNPRLFACIRPAGTYLPGIFVTPGLDMLGYSLQAPNAALNRSGVPHK